MKIYRLAVAWILIIPISFFIYSCDKDNTQNKPDFRDNLVGSYICLETFFYFNPIGDSMNWSTDTISFDREIVIEKHQDSSVNVIIGTYSFIGTFDANERFTCLNCIGPPDYARFFNEDSLYIYRKYGVTNHRNYYGKKQ